MLNKHYIAFFCLALVYVFNVASAKPTGKVQVPRSESAVKDQEIIFHNDGKTFYYHNTDDGCFKYMNYEDGYYYSSPECS